jgi:hypothetical protein
MKPLLRASKKVSRAHYSMSSEHWMRRTFWLEYLRISIFFPLDGTMSLGTMLYKVTLAPSIGTTKHDAS